MWGNISPPILLKRLMRSVMRNGSNSRFAGKKKLQDGPGNCVLLSRVAGSRTHGGSPLVEPILVVLGLCAVTIPIATVFLLWRQYRLREQLLRLTDLTMEVTDGLRRDLLELKRQVEAAQPQPPASSVPAAAAVPKS